ncbi:MAG: YibE/F family protein [Candidatus Shapirobacteria bacterium]|nr:YibE/F family protein [Candidatus Shapirobacteria bacterium]
MKKIFLFFTIFFSCFFSLSKNTLAMDLYYRAQVTKVLEDKIITTNNTNQRTQTLELKIIDSKNPNQSIITVTNGAVLDNGEAVFSAQNYYQIDDWLYLSQDINPLSGQIIYQIADFDRSSAIFLLFMIFIIAVLLISSWHGLRSLLSMSFSFLAIFFFILPNIYHGSNPILIVTLGIIFIIPITFYLSHGLNKKTTAAIIGTIISLFIAVTLSLIFIKLAKLTGTTSEESGFLLSLKPSFFNFKSILLSGIIIGVLGVIDDITISQSAVVSQLRIANPKNKKIFFQAMVIGKDHISSMINTLVLVYAGASLPLLLLFVDNQLPIGQLISFEPIAEEIIRTLIGSIALIIAVPITTFIATKLIKN